MNGQAHANILLGAYGALPEPLRKALAPVEALLPQVANYPDLFDDPTRSVEDKATLDPEWRRFCVLPATLPGRCLHGWPHPNTAQAQWRPITEHWLSEAIDAWRRQDLPGFAKFIGCLSHFFGDVTQPAHLTDLTLLAELLPAPATRPGFHYHTDLEAVTGNCDPLRAPQLLGLDVAEVAWRVAMRNTQAMHACRRCIVPTLQALFAGQTAEAEREAILPVTLAAQLTADLWYTAWKLATGEVGADEARSLNVVDLRTWPPDGAMHDSVYGGAIVDGNRCTPPSGAPIVPARLRFPDGVIRPVQGLGVLPHSGMYGPRTCWLRYSLPPGVFDRFEARVGLHADLVRDGAVAFVVETDAGPVFHSGRRTVHDPALPVVVQLGSCRELTLCVEDANAGKTFWNNHAFWADPRLVRA